MVKPIFILLFCSTNKRDSCANNIHTDNNSQPASQPAMAKLSFGAEKKNCLHQSFKQKNLIFHSAQRCTELVAVAADAVIVIMSQPHKKSSALIHSQRRNHKPENSSPSSLCMCVGLCHTMMAIRRVRTSTFLIFVAILGVLTLAPNR